MKSIFTFSKKGQLSHKERANLAITKLRTPHFGTDPLSNLFRVFVMETCTRTNTKCTDLLIATSRIKLRSTKSCLFQL